MKVQIGEYEFDLAKPFGQGHVLSGPEALALNGARAERIRNAIYRRYIRLGGGILSAEDLQGLREYASTCDRTFKFEEPKGPPKSTSEFAGIVRDLVQEWSRKGMGEPAELANNRDLLAEANRILSAKRDAAARALEELIE